MPTDPICGMHVPDSSNLKIQQDEEVYYFCSTTCKIKFQEPEKERKSELIALIVAWSFTIPILIINYVFEFQYKNYLMLILALPVQFYSGLHFYRGAYQAIKMHSGNMDLLVTMGTLTAFAFSAIITLFPNILPIHAVYFDASVFIISIIMTGDYLQSLTETKANNAARKLLKNLPSTVHLITKEGLKEVDASAVKKDDIILIKPGETIAVDGEITEGKTEINESMLTGEPEPVVKVKGANVISGTQNINGVIKVKVEKAGKDSIISQMYSMIKKAATGKLKVQKMADVFSSYFVPVVITAAVISAIIWFVVLTIGNSSLVYDITILSFVSVIVIACPCAIGLATPITLLIASNISSSKYILLKNVNAFDRLSKVNIIILDKTGTLTDPKPELKDIILVKKAYNSAFILKYAASLEQYSNHPIAKAITAHASYKKIDLFEVSNIEERPGEGVYGVINGEVVSVRRAKEKNTIGIYINDSLLGEITLSYKIKESAKQLISKFKSIGIPTAMITGDSKAEAERVAEILGINEKYYEVAPDKKAEIIKEYQKNGKYVMYAGDGINDAIALESADFGVAMSIGSEIAKESGDAVLLKDDLNLLYDLYLIGKLTIKKVKQNIGWAVGYNIVLIPVAGGALVPLFGLGMYSVLPLLAATAMGMSSVSVVLNSLLLKGKVYRKLSKF